MLITVFAIAKLTNRTGSYQYRRRNKLLKTQDAQLQTLPTFGIKLTTLTLYTPLSQNTRTARPMSTQ